MALKIISDLHVHSPEDHIYLSLLRWLSDEVAAGDTCVFLGDIFDLFVGKKEIFTNRYSEFIRLIFKRAKEDKVDFRYIEGNHDFDLRGVFESVPGFKLEDSESHITIDGKRILLAHGDLANPFDIKYRALRLFFRSPVMKGLVKISPGQWLDWVGSRSSKYSRNHRPVLPSQLCPPDLEEVRKIYRNYAVDKMLRGADCVVLGHSHDLDEMVFRVGDRETQYINMGYPPVHGYYLEWDTQSHKMVRKVFQ